jgi:predicted esterase
LHTTQWTRRQFFERSALATAALAGACASSNEPDTPSAGRLSIRPGRPGAAAPARGRQALGLGTARDGFLYVPTSYEHSRAAPLLVLFHGAGRSANEWGSAQSVADSLGIVLLVPDSRGVSWDAVRAAFGPDLAFVDAALALTFSRVNIDPQRMGMAGFSDGASYALSLGLANGDFMAKLLAFSPGLIAPAQRRGKPAIYVTHGTRDTVLPIAATSRLIVPALRADGYTVEYIEFDGAHELPLSIGTLAFEWFVATGSSSA